MLTIDTVSVCYSIKKASNCDVAFLMTDEALVKLPNHERRIIFDFLHSLPLNIDVEVNGIKYKLVHGSPIDKFDEQKTRWDSVIEYAVWQRWMPGDFIPEGYTLIFGHTPTYKFDNRNPLCIWYGENAIGIDCGSGIQNTFCSPKGRLGCLRLDDMKEFYSECTKN